MNAGKVEKKTKLSKSVLSNVARATLAVEQLYIYVLWVENMFFYVCLFLFFCFLLCFEC